MISFGFYTAFELALVVAVVWGIFHEDKLISFERRILASFKRRKLRVVKAKAYAYGILEPRR